MPLTETGFNAAKDGVTSRIRTEKIRRNGIIWNFLDAERHGLDYDIRKNIFDSVSNMTMDNIREVNSAFLKDKKKTYIVLGKESELDFAGLEKLGPVTKLTLEEIFGY